MIRMDGLHTIIVRTGMLLFWVAIIAGFLIVPNYISFSGGSQVLTILAMPNTISADQFHAFEKLHGVKVHLTYAESADEIYMKLAATGASGYDLVMTADYQISLLWSHGLIQKLDKKKLGFFNDFYPALLNHTFDPGNEYSIPYYWGVYGFAVDTDYFGDRKDMGWDDIFDEQKISYCIGMREDPREIILMAALYLFGHTDTLSNQEFAAIKDLLIKQKKWVTLYADERIGGLLASRSCPLVVTLTGDIMRTMAHYPYIKFYIPREGGFVDIDSFAIPVTSKKTEVVYAFLNYLYSPDILGYYVKQFQFISPLTTVSSTTHIPDIAFPSKELFKRLHFFDAPIPSAILSDIIVALKTA